MKVGHGLLKWKTVRKYVVKVNNSGYKKNHEMQNVLISVVFEFL